MAYCCYDCPSEFILPWDNKKKDIAGVVVEVEHQFRGRVNSDSSKPHLDYQLPLHVVTQQPQEPSAEQDRARCQKMSMSSLDSALLTSSTGILSQILKAKNASKSHESPQALISFVIDLNSRGINVFQVTVNGYQSLFLIKTSSKHNRDGSEHSLLQNLAPSLIIRFTVRNQIRFTSIQSRTKTPTWTENIAFCFDQKNHLDSLIHLVLYESNRFSRWTAVRSGQYNLRDILSGGTQNVIIDLHPIISDQEVYGEIKLGMCYIKNSNRIVLEVSEVRSLFHWALNRSTEYFVKVQFFEGKKLIKIKKTAAVRLDERCSMEVHESVHAAVVIAALNYISVTISVCDGKQIVGDSCFYFLTFGGEDTSGATEGTYWSDFVRGLPSISRKQWFALKLK